MKRNFVLAIFCTSVLLLGISCKKKSSSTTDTSTSSTTSASPVTNTPASSFSVNGVGQGANPVLVKGASGTVYEFLLAGSPWTIGAFFSGTVSPASGSYPVESTNSSQIPAGKCFFSAAGQNNQGGVAQNGTVVVSTGASNTISFTNLIISLTPTSSTSYTVSGTIVY